jgi:uncharacterized protein DUF4953/uncharacterized protein DUF5117
MQIKSYLLILSIIVFSNAITAQKDTTNYVGYFPFKWIEKNGKIMLDVSNKVNKEFLYVNSLSSGIGSNDIGLDRNQLGGSRVVKFIRSGPKILLIQPNYRYRAISDNALERQAVEQAFAQSVLWGFKVKQEGAKMWIDMTSFLLRDAHNVAGALERKKQGTYSLDQSRSAVSLERTKNFPDNSEFDAIITFKGKAKGGFIRSVTPTSNAVTVHMHHSFVRLPNDDYTPREYDPRSGFISMSYYDYATPIDQPLEKRFIRRHRLKKKNPSAVVSDPVEPIIYYIDAGCPEPIKSALMEGAEWWNQAFEAAGYKDAFQIMELPAGADPMDVRYNMINWVHRSTRGWSYGSSVTDPRTGEIIKGHVLLGSLRVRQDYMLAQGLTSLFENGDEKTAPMVEMALARLRQLATHEVGHTLGLTHNFASSVNDRASVMDYPHPYIKLNDDGSLDFSEAYDIGIGEWDKRMILFGYQDFPEGVEESTALEVIVNESIEMGLKFISDRDARPAGGGHPYAHLWENGTDPVQELYRLIELRKNAMLRFGVNTIPEGEYMAYLEQVLVPLYLNHRYQVEAVSKLIGGVDYSYKLRGDAQSDPVAVTREEQINALQALIITLEPAFLAIDARIVSLIPPLPEGVSRSRELFKSNTGLFFDPLAAAEGSANHTLSFALHPQRLARLLNQRMYDDEQLGLGEYMDNLIHSINGFDASTVQLASLKMMVEKRLVHHLLGLASNKSEQQQVSALAMQKLFEIEGKVKMEYSSSESDDQKAHAIYIIHQIENYRNNPADLKLPTSLEMPPGSPIGCGGELFLIDN